MMTARTRHILCLLAVAGMPIGAAAQSTGGERITLAASEPERVIEERLSGDQTVEYRLTASQGQRLSVELATEAAGVHFNIKSATDDQFLFAGMMAGNVANVSVPADGDYVVQVFLTRAAARRGEPARYTLTVGLGADARPDTRTTDPAHWQVRLEDAAAALNVRSGPGTQYAVTGRLADAETLENLGCRRGEEQRWCDIRAVDSDIRGWVAGRFLVKGSVAGEPQGFDGLGRIESGGRAFDTSGQIDCVLEPGQPAQACDFGAIRDGPGNAGVWIALPAAKPLHILFESGMVTAVGTGADYVARKTGGHYEIDTGMRQFFIPETVVAGKQAVNDDDDAVDGDVTDNDAIEAANER